MANFNNVKICITNLAWNTLLTSYSAQIAIWVS